MARDIVVMLLVGGIVVLGVFLLSLVTIGERTTSALESIHGIPYPMLDGTIRVEESLAHTDVYLREPVLAKRLVLDISFIPHIEAHLAVGVRENEFWLSYPKHTFYTATGSQTTTVERATVVIPLTDALQDKDQSIDVMFFSLDRAGDFTIDAGVLDTTRWDLVSLNARVEYAPLTWQEIKNYVASVVKRERPL